MPGGISKTKWQLARQLLHPRGRRRSGAVLVEGARAVETALASPKQVSFLMIGPEASPRCADPVQLAATHGIETFELAAEQARTLAGTVSPQQIFAVVRWVPRRELTLPLPAFVLHLSGVRDPRNMGPLLRTATAFGVTVSCSPDCVDITNPETIRSGAAAYFEPSPFADIPLSRLEQEAADHSTVYAAAHGGVELGRFEWPAKTILVLGGEAAGATERTENAVSVTIPIAVESLNTAVAGAILLWDARRGGRV